LVDQYFLNKKDQYLIKSLKRLSDMGAALPFGLTTIFISKLRYPVDRLAKASFNMTVRVRGETKKWPTGRPYMEEF